MADVHPRWPTVTLTNAMQQVYSSRNSPGDRRPIPEASIIHCMSAGRESNQHCWVRASIIRAVLPGTAVLGPRHMDSLLTARHQPSTE
jgi:hypothetical protein